jgi:hypothetical protein
MKTLKFLMIAIVIAGTTIISSCKKEDRIEKNLWNKGGEWNIDRLSVTQVSTDPIDNYNETLGNVGTITFNENGSGLFTYTVDGDTDTEAFTYSNTEDKLTLVFGNDVREFNMTWEKDNITLNITDNYTSNGESITYTETMELKKK